MNPGESARPGRADRRGPEGRADQQVIQAEPPQRVETAEPVRPPRRPRRFSIGALVFISLLVLALGFLAWRSRPIPVRLVQPRIETITETIAAAGEVAGQRETAVGAQVQGVVTDLRVREGSEVRRGDILGQIRNEVAEAQVRQAQQALETARAQLAQTAVGPRQSEVRAGEARVMQAQAAVAERRAGVDQARAALQQSEARLNLARRDVQRYEYLLREKAVARQRVDQARTEFRVAQADVTAARERVETAQASLRAAQAVLSGAEADLKTLRAGPRSEAVEVARRRVREAEAALRVAREQAANYLIRAPFTGTVTEIVAEVGSSVGPGGVLRLVETTRPEIQVDVDEENLAELRVGQRAVVTSPTFRNARFEAPVTRISPRVDPTRGTVEVTLVPEEPPSWLRPGQTVNVEIITSQAARRLTLPVTAIRRDEGRSVVLRVREGRTLARPVVLGEVAGDVVPILEGVQPEDRVVLDARKVETGERVRVTGGG